MKKLLSSLVVGLVLLVGTVGQVKSESFATVPNLKACYYYDFNSKVTSIGAESTLLKYKAFNFNVGYIDTDNVTSTVLSSISVDLDKLGTVEYIWKDLYTSIGVFCGYNFKESKYAYGVSATLIKIEFTK